MGDIFTVEIVICSTVKKDVGMSCVNPPVAHPYLYIQVTLKERISYIAWLTASK